VQRGSDYKIVEYGADKQPSLKDVRSRRHPSGFNMQTMLAHRATADWRCCNWTRPPRLKRPAARSARPTSPSSSAGRFTVAGIGVTVRGDGKSGGGIRVAGLVATGKPGTLQIRLVDPVGQGTRDGLGACTGDSGAPVFEDKKTGPVIIGVVSWSTGPNGSAGCGGLTGVTPLTLYRDWLVQTRAAMGRGGSNSVLRCLVGRGVVEHDQAVDGDADLAVDQERIDVDRGDAASRIRHQVGLARPAPSPPKASCSAGFAAITLQLDAGLGLAAISCFASSAIEWRAGERDILHQFDVDTARCRTAPPVPFRASSEAPTTSSRSALTMLRDQDAFELRLVLQLLDPRRDVVERFLYFAALLMFSTTPPMSDLLQDVGRLTTFATTGKPILSWQSSRRHAAVCAISSLADGNAVGPQQLL